MTSTPTRTVQSSNKSEKAHLPAILCLHGSGSTSSVFMIQARRLIWNFESQFRFVFAEGPYESVPGHGMLPVFESCAPFYRWVTKKYDGNVINNDTELTPVREVEILDQTLRSKMEANGGVDSFVGVMGFSMGGRVVAGLLHRQQMDIKEKGSCWTKFKFGIMIGAPYPPIALTKTVDVSDYDVLKTIPTVHAWGKNDPFKAGCADLAKTCDGDVCFTLDFNGGHHLPLTDTEARDLSDMIRAAWYAGGGQDVQVGEDAKQ